MARQYSALNHPLPVGTRVEQRAAGPVVVYELEWHEEQMRRNAAQSAAQAALTGTQIHTHYEPSLTGHDQFPHTD